MEKIIMSTDVLWNTILKEALEDSGNDPALSGYLYSTILSHESLEAALSHQLAKKLADEHHFPFDSFRKLLTATLHADKSLGDAMRKDVVAVATRDPACSRHYLPILFFKGFLSLQAHRISHHLWMNGRKLLALYFQSRISEVFAVDIHPAARIGSGILLDHATGVVIGETTVIEDNVSILHAVTLGGTGKTHGDRHPKIRSGVLIGAGAKILGNIEIGTGVKVGAGSVVLQSIPPHQTAVGNPAAVKGKTITGQPALDMDIASEIL
ncbi:MAG: serine O-acetyltransferase [Burkholderiales bacterium]